MESINWRSTIYVRFCGYNLDIANSLQYGIVCPQAMGLKLKENLVLCSFSEAFNFIGDMLNKFKNTQFGNNNTPQELNGLKSNLAFIQESVSAIQDVGLKNKFQTLLNQYKFRVYQLVMMLEGKAA